mmetsp:Transcript_8643/g.29103  ORF Transcript_8643/g.29103 Transcript_8643/m.29103 type:complete len:147 (-) Transcript_8643:923-1363(-)
MESRFFVPFCAEVLPPPGRDNAARHTRPRCRRHTWRARGNTRTRARKCDSRASRARHAREYAPNTRFTRLTRFARFARVIFNLSGSLPSRARDVAQSESGQEAWGKGSSWKRTESAGEGWEESWGSGGAERWESEGQGGEGTGAEC